MTLIERWGQLPHMAAAGTAEVSFPAGEGTELYALDTAGRRLAPVPLTLREGRAFARLNVFNPFGPDHALRTGPGNKRPGGVSNITD